MAGNPTITPRSAWAVKHCGPVPFREPWFPDQSSSRLNITAVRDQEGLGQAYELARIPELACGMEFPRNLEWSDFERIFHELPMKDIFLLNDRESGKTAGLVIFCPFQEKKHWHQILYGIRPDFWGRGLALEACRALLGRMAREQVSEGVVATVMLSNFSSLRVTRGLGMTMRSGAPRTRWELPLGNTNSVEAGRPGASARLGIA